MKAFFTRLWAWLVRQLTTGHLGPLAGLAALHVAVMGRLLRGGHGTPHTAIPYDFQDSYSRFLIFISDTLHAGALPTWFPYGHAGTPFFVNPQSQLWTPVTWLLTLVPGYSLLVAQWQDVFTLLLGSIGVYFLAWRLWGTRAAAWLCAVAFNFTSARLCNAEHMDIVTAFSLFPWIFWGLERLCRGERWAVPVLGMLWGLLVVSGYPGVVLLSPLWFLGWATWLLVGECPDRAARRRFLVGLVQSLLLGLGIASGYCLCIAANLGAFSRGAPLDTDAALLQSLSPSDLWHLVFGVSTALKPEGVITDMSMRGLYFGIVALALAGYAVLSRRKPVVTVLASGFLLALLMSLGRYFFARVALHDYLPMFNFSRFPAGDSRAVVALAGSLLAGGGLAHLLEEPEGRSRFARMLVGAAVLLLAGYVWLKNIIYPGVPAAQLAESFNNVVLVELLAVLVALVGLVRFTQGKAVAACLLLACALDSGMHTGSDAVLFAHPAGDRVRHFVDIRTGSFDAANALGPRVDAAAVLDVRSNDGYLNKRFYLGSYSPFFLKGFARLFDSEFKNFMVKGRRIVGFVGGQPPERGAAFEQAALPVDFQITRYLPDRVDYVVQLPARTTLVFNEMYFPGWRARVDQGATVAMAEVAGGFRALTVEAGRHVIATRFSPWSFWVGLVTTIAGWLLALAWLARTTFLRRRPQPAVTP
jgi:hypothetical protein